MQRQVPSIAPAPHCATRERAMSAADDEFDDARNTFYDDDGMDGGAVAREHTLEGALRPHVDQHDEFASDGSDGDDDSALGSEDESDGEDLMNDMERCVVFVERCVCWCMGEEARSRSRVEFERVRDARSRGAW